MSSKDSIIIDEYVEQLIKKKSKYSMYEKYVDQIIKKNDKNDKPIQLKEVWIKMKDIVEKNSTHKERMKNSFGKINFYKWLDTEHDCIIVGNSKTGKLIRNVELV